MENINACGWIYTPEEVEEIKKSNVKAMTSFYYNNYNHILAICKGYLFRCKCIYKQGNIIELDDLLNQVFIDLPCYNFNCLFFEILKTCRRISYSGLYTVSIDEVLSSSTRVTLGERLEDKTDYFNLSEDLAEREEKDRKIFDFLENYIKDEKHRNEVFCLAFTDIPLKEIKGNEYKTYRNLRERV